MEIEKLAEIILKKYRNGQRHFSNYGLENENLSIVVLRQVILVMRIYPMLTWSNLKSMVPNLREQI